MKILTLENLEVMALKLIRMIKSELYMIISLRFKVLFN